MEKELNLPLVIYRIAGSIEEFASQMKHNEDCIKDSMDADCSCGLLPDMADVVNHAREIQRILSPEKDSL